MFELWVKISTVNSIFERSSELDFKQELHLLGGRRVHMASLFTTAIAVILVLLGFIWLLKQFYYHPLSVIPGPLLNRFSELPAAVALVKGNQHSYYRSLHEKYGPVVRVSPNEVSFISVEARDEIYGFRKRRPNMEKSPIFLGAVGSIEGQTGLSLALNEDHARQRKALGFLFTNSALLRQERLLQLHIHKFITNLTAAANTRRSVECSSWYTYLAFDVMGDLCFAEPFGCLDQQSDTEWSTSVINIFMAATWTQGIRRISGVGNWLERVLVRLLVPAKAAKWRNLHLSNSEEKTIRRLADPDRDHPDFMYHILSQEESKGSLSRTELMLNMALFISAGTDTVATALTGWTYFVCTHPAVYQRLITEVRGEIEAEDSIEWEKVKNLRFLEATMNEALRLFPPSPASQQRVVPIGGASIDGYYIPAGSTVAVSPWTSTHSPLNFHDPDKFIPERWLGEDERCMNDKLRGSLPFGTGPRVCIARNLAYLELRLCAAHLLWNFDLELDKGVYRDRNYVWGLNGEMRPMKVFHSMTKPDLWINLTQVQR